MDSWRITNTRVYDANAVDTLIKKHQSLRVEKVMQVFFAAFAILGVFIVISTFNPRLSQSLNKPVSLGAIGTIKSFVLIYGSMLFALVVGAAIMLAYAYGRRFSLKDIEAFEIREKTVPPVEQACDNRDVQTNTKALQACISKLRNSLAKEKEKTRRLQECRELALDSVRIEKRMQDQKVQELQATIKYLEEQLQQSSKVEIDSMMGSLQERDYTEAFQINTRSDTQRHVPIEQYEALREQHEQFQMRTFQQVQRLEAENSQLRNQNVLSTAPPRAAACFSLSERESELSSIEEGDESSSTSENEETDEQTVLGIKRSPLPPDQRAWQGNMFRRT
jgi:hypothetical protein